MLGSIIWLWTYASYTASAYMNYSRKGPHHTTDINVNGWEPVLNGIMYMRSNKRLFFIIYVKTNLFEYANEEFNTKHSGHSKQKPESGNVKTKRRKWEEIQSANVGTSFTKLLAMQMEDNRTLLST